MTSLFIENAAAISPLGANLSELWLNVLAGEVKFNRAILPGDRYFFASETFPESASDISRYSSLFYEAIHKLVAELKVSEPVDAIFFATAVGNLADVENNIYSDLDIAVEQLDFAASEDIFSETVAMGSNTRFICVPTGCCAGLQAIGLAKSVMPKLGLKTAIIMSLDFGLTPLGFEAFNKINATFDYSESVKTSPSRPFCKDRSGFLFADGGGAILVNTESLNSETPYISGYGCVSSAFHMTDIETDGRSIRASIERALDSSGITGKAIDHVNLHASGTQQNDEAEYKALLNVIGGELPDITAFKGNHGHALGGSNMIEVALSWKMFKEKLIPPTPKDLPVDAYNAVAPRDQAKPFHGKVILKTASGFSGIHAALVMEK